MSRRAYRTIYVGNLPGDVREREVEDLFYNVLSHLLSLGYLYIFSTTTFLGRGLFFLHLLLISLQSESRIETGSLIWYHYSWCFALWLMQYGLIVGIELKIPPRPPGFAFVEFEDERDAEDAIRGRDGYDFECADFQSL
ncbi:hypothetical protein Drorol1_Dr00006667 [Drosera rotundifolia]